MANIFKSLIDEIKNFYLSRQEKALVLTLVVMIFIVLGLMILQLQNAPKEIMLEFQIPPEEFVDMEKVLEQEKLEQEIAETKATTNAYNEADSRIKHSDEPFKTLEELIEEQNALRQGEKGDPNDDGIEEAGEKSPIKDPVVERVRELMKQNTPKQGTISANKNAYVKYYLADRSDVALPVPIYTCDASGIVVINITVNHLGQVTNALYNAKSSTSSNGCLIDQALIYARKARFDKSDKTQQLGTITYHFQPK